MKKQTSRSSSPSNSPPKEQYVSKYKAKVQWDKHFGQKTRTAFAAMGRLNRVDAGAVRVVSFEYKEKGEEGGSPTKNRITLRLPAEYGLVDVQREVGKGFGWKEPAALFQKDGHGWEVPVATQGQMIHAFDTWEEEAGPRTHLKYDALFSEVESLLLRTDDSTEQLRGAGAAWELACREGHHDLLGEGFIESLQSLLTSGSFAAVCHAAAAIRIETVDVRVDNLCGRFWQLGRAQLRHKDLGPERGRGRLVPPRVHRQIWDDNLILRRVAKMREGRVEKGKARVSIAIDKAAHRDVVVVHATAEHIEALDGIHCRRRAIEV